MNSLEDLTLTRTEGRAKQIYASQNPEQLHEGWNEASAKENSPQTPTHVPFPDAWINSVIYLWED